MSSRKEGEGQEKGCGVVKDKLNWCQDFLGTKRADRFLENLFVELPRLHGYIKYHKNVCIPSFTALEK